MIRRIIRSLKSIYNSYINRWHPSLPEYIAAHKTTFNNHVPPGLLKDLLISPVSGAYRLHENLSDKTTISYGYESIALSKLISLDRLTNTSLIEITPPSARSFCALQFPISGKIIACKEQSFELLSAVPPHTIITLQTLSGTRASLIIIGAHVKNSIHMSYWKKKNCYLAGEKLAVLAPGDTSVLVITALKQHAFKDRHKKYTLRFGKRIARTA